MTIEIGIDTGGTCTDAVVCDRETGEVLAAGKALTTRENLTVGIGNALDLLPEKYLHAAKTVSLSTTLATNACVENKGGRAKLLLVGTTRKVLGWISAEKKYGLRNDDIMCLDTHPSFDGKVVDEPDWDAVTGENETWFADAEALSVAEIYSFKNGAVCEKNAKKYLHEKYNIPVVPASELVSGLDMMERGATALLNARLLPVICEFTDAARKALEMRGISAEIMTVRSDGSLMSCAMSEKKPVETILSGPAASVIGAKALTDCENCVVIDMGGTTTDVSLVKNGRAVTVDGGIRIGGWKTQVRGVFTDTFALGGDTEIVFDGGAPALGNRRVIPLCVAATRFPDIKADIKRITEQTFTHYTLPVFYVLIREPEPSRFGENEKKLCAELKKKPCLTSAVYETTGVEAYKTDLERLESEGIIMRSAITPTDMMHVKGDFTLYDSQTARAAAAYYASCLPASPDPALAFADTVYGLIKKKLYINIVRILLHDKFPALSSDADAAVSGIVSETWESIKSGKTDAFFGVSFTSGAALTGVGAPTHIFLPDVAAALGAKCVIPENAGVANAVGAVCADIRAAARVLIKPIIDEFGLSGYSVHSQDGVSRFEERADAVLYALEAAEKEAIDEARRRGATGELNIEKHIEDDTGKTNEGKAVDLGSVAFASVSSNKS